MEEILEGYRLSPQQRHLWLLQQDNNYNPAYSSACVARLIGPIDAAAFEKAIASVIEQHEILRTSFQFLPGMTTPLQVIGDEPDPQVSFELTRVAAEEHVLTVSVPALCGDSAGVMNLVRELARCYSADQPEAEAPLQYLIASEWQNRLLEDEEAAEGREFWREREVKGVSSSLAFAPRRFAASLPGTESTAFLLACWQVLLWKLSGESRVVVGAAFAGRSYPELAGALGLFTRYLPLTVELQGEQRFAAVVSAAAAQLQEAAEWQEYFSWPSERSYCAYAFADEEQPESFRSGAVQWQIETVQSCVERYQVKLQCRRRETGVELEWHYDSAVVSEAAVARLAEQFQTLVQSAQRDPESPLARLEMVSAAERVQLIEEWNRTAVDYAGAAECLHEQFAAQAARTPEAVAVVYEGAALTYAELERRANQLARYLQAQGVGPETVVGLLQERSLELVVSLLGVLKAGAAYLPLDAGYPEARLRYMLKDAGVRVLLTEPELLARVGAADCEVVCVGAEWARIAECSATPVTSKVSAANVAYVIYTSGSTGQPKGVMITHAAISNHMQWMQQAYGLEAEDAVLQKTPFSFDASVWEFYAPLLSGARLVMARPGGHQDSQYLVRVMQEEQVSILQGVPSLLRLLASEAGLSGCGLRRVFSGGERLAVELAAQLWERLPGVELINLYGPTEATIDATHRSYPPGTTEEGIGRPVANMRCYVLDDEQRLAPLGALGELWLGGVDLARGYLARPDVTAEKFVPDELSGRSGERLYRTGDLVRYRLDGDLDYIGRADGQLKVRGHRLEVGEIEQRLRQHPSIADAVVSGKDVNGQVERLVGYVVLQPGSELRVEELRRHLETTLPNYMVPAAWVQLEKLPLMANGKVDRRALPEPDNTRPELEGAYVAPVTPVEQTLADIWSEVLDIKGVGVNDNFFALGGDSIRSIQVMALAKEKGLSFSIQQLFEWQTIQQLAQVLEVSAGDSDRARRTEPFSLIGDQDRQALPAAVEDAYPLTSLQSGMLYHMELRPAGAPVYHNVNSFHVRAALHVPALQRAIQRVVDRHPIMRTGFELTRYSEPLQLVYKTSPIEVFEGEDLSYRSPEEQQEAITRFMRTQYEHAFDLARPPLVRFSVHRRSPETFQYTLTENHAISDGWSTTSMFAEIFDYYFAELNGEPTAEEPLPSFTFRDFVQLEQEALKSPECRDFWDEKLRDFTPMRLPRWSNGDANGGEAKKHGFIGLVFGAELYEGLKGLAQLAQVPFKTVLLTAHMKVLSMACAQSDVMTALATNGRPEETGGDRVRGLFINMVPFRMEISDGSWFELVKQTFAGEREILPYRRYPLAAIQKNHNTQRLLETAFNFVHFHSLASSVRSGNVELISSGTKDMADTSFTMNTGFTIGITSLTKPRLEMGLEYDANELSEEQIKTIVDSYIKALKAMARDPYASHTQWTTSHLLTEQDQLLLAQSTHIEELAGSFAF